MTHDLQYEMYDFFCHLTGEEVIRFLTNKLGMQIMTDWLAEEMREELGFESEELEDDD